MMPHRFAFGMFVTLLLQAVEGLSSDGQTLLVFKRQIVSYGAGANLSSWDENDADPCTGWQGVSCSSSLSVSGLYLPSLGLGGNLSGGGLALLPELTTLNLSSNFFSGPIPADLTANVNSSLLTVLDLSNNRFTGDIPQALVSSCNIVSLNLSFNQLTGEVPSRGICNRSADTVSIDLSNNRLNGTIPQQLLGVEGMYFLNLSNNGLTGSIPYEVSDNPTIAVLDASNNQLAGELANGMTNFVNLQQLWLFNNQLSGSIPDAVGNLAKLRDIRLGSNNLTGPIPSAMMSLEFLTVVDCTNNSLQFTAPHAGSQLPPFRLFALQELHFGWNQLSGPIPLRLLSLGNLRVVDLSHNHLNHSIPEAMGDLNLLSSVDLSFNDFSGHVPAKLIDLQPQHLNLSYNSLSGKLPESASRYNACSFAGNPALCGSPLQACPPGAGSRFLGMKRQYWIAAGTAAGGVILMGAWMVWHWRGSSEGQQDADLVAAMQDRLDSASLMSLRELRKATANFSDSLEIGVGGFGRVYSGRLSDGTRVAVKRSRREGSVGDKHQFLNEVKILSKVNHRHLVRLLGCCLENKIALLVFEYVPNGTLYEHLQGERGSSRLSWGQRLDIAVQTAEALAYLHSAANPPIFHRDVKSANILLDQNLNAKVADFGISKLVPMEATHVSTQAIQGTLGYIDPEYYQSFQLTAKSDVYSFGVVLLELLSAQAPLDFSRECQAVSLVTMALPLINCGALHTLLDVHLLPTFGTQRGRESIQSLANLAVQCLQFSGRQRPSMKHVLTQLQILKTNCLIDSSLDPPPPPSPESSPPPLPESSPPPETSPHSPPESSPPPPPESSPPPPPPPESSLPPPLVCPTAHLKLTNLVPYS